jgi:hypothetical protein
VRERRGCAFRRTQRLLTLVRCASRFFRLPAGNIRKQWSEVNMSEDFDLA